MIYITGDCHGNYCKFNTNAFPEQKYMTKDDYVIICGDFGFWDNSKEQNYWRNWLEKKPFTTLWVDGNHENYDLLSTIETDTWNGGKVQFIKPSDINLMCGQVYEIDKRSPAESIMYHGGKKKCRRKRNLKKEDGIWKNIIGMWIILLPIAVLPVHRKSLVFALV